MSPPGPVPTLGHVRGAHKRSTVGGMEQRKVSGGEHPSLGDNII